MRVIKIDSNRTVIAVKSGLKESYELEIDEIESDLGEIGQFMLEDGGFVDVEQPQSEPKASIEEIAEETLLETKYQTFILEMMM